MSDTTYCYAPDYTVLKNKAGIEDTHQLERFERLKTINRQRFCLDNIPITYNGYKQIHAHLFQDVYTWTGQPRRVNISKGEPFAFWQHIDQEMAKRFALINKENNLRGLNVESFAQRAAEHLNEINAIHPFREGNGRTQRIFLQNLAHQAGHELEITRFDQRLWMKASIEGFRNVDYRPMQACILGSLILIPL